MQVQYRFARERERMLVVVREQVGDAGDARMDIAAAERFGIDDFARGGANQRRTAEKDRACAS